MRVTEFFNKVNMSDIATATGRLKYLRIVLLTFVLVSMISSSVLAAVQIKIVNKSRYRVMAAYYTPSGDPNWGSDRFSEYLDPGETMVVTFTSGNPDALWDFKFVLAGGRETYKYQFDVYRYNTLEIVY